MPTVSLREYARHRRISHTAVQKVIRQGRIRTTPDGSIDVEQADRDWERNTGPAAPPRRAPTEQGIPPGTPRGPSFAQSRAVRELYLARMAKLDFEERSGTLVHLVDVENTLFVVDRVLRDHLLSLPDRLAASLAAETEATQVRSILRKEIWDGLTELSKSLAARGLPGSGAGQDGPEEDGKEPA